MPTSHLSIGCATEHQYLFNDLNYRVFVVDGSGEDHNVNLYIFMNLYTQRCSLNEVTIYIYTN